MSNPKGKKTEERRCVLYGRKSLCKERKEWGAFKFKGRAAFVRSKSTGRNACAQQRLGCVVCVVASL